MTLSNDPQWWREKAADFTARAAAATARSAVSMYPGMRDEWLSIAADCTEAAAWCEAQAELLDPPA